MQISSAPLPGLKLNQETCYVTAGIQSEPKCVKIKIEDKNLKFQSQSLKWGEGRKTFLQSPFALIFTIT